MATDPWTFGEAPLPETYELATLLREVAGHAMALEHPTDALRETVALLREAERRLRTEVPADLRPRIAHRVEPERRVYLDHSRAMGSWNPTFPAYTLTCSSAGEPDATAMAEGEVTFAIVAEGPPGTAHGGVVAQLFDCVLQQLNCDLGTAGRTTSLEVRYRRPVPLLVPVRITATSDITGSRIRSSARLERDGMVLCEASMVAESFAFDDLPHVAPRRPA